MAAEWTKDDVRAIAPEFISLDDAALDLFIGYAEQLVNPKVFSARTKFAGSLMTAHLITVTPSLNAAPKQGAGPVASRTAGPVSITYAVPQLDDGSISAGLSMSKYGIMFANLTRRSAVGFGLL